MTNLDKLPKAELLRCPACEKLMQGTETTSNSTENMVRYTCNCGVSGPWAFSDKGYNYEKAKEAARAMSRHPTPIAAPDGLRSALEAILSDDMATSQKPDKGFKQWKEGYDDGIWAVKEEIRIALTAPSLAAQGER